MSEVLDPPQAAEPHPCDGLQPCPECPYGGPKVGSRGRIDAPVCVIGEAPGVQELIKKIPLTGPSGKVFWAASQDIKPEDIFVLNALQCRPPTTKDPRVNEHNLARGAFYCRKRLLEQVYAFPRELIITLGNTAIRSLTGNSNWKITQSRGMLLQGEVGHQGKLMGHIGLLPMVHPAALLRGTGNYRQFRMDMAYASGLLRGEPPKKPIAVEEVVVIESERMLWQMVKELLPAPEIGADIETTGFNRITDRVLCLGLSADARKVWVVPPKYLPMLGFFFRYYKGRFVWHNGKFDISFLRRIPQLGKARVDEDTMLLSYCEDETGGIHDLEQLSGDLLGAPDYKHMLKPYLPKKSSSYELVPKPILYKYMALDVSNTLQNYWILRPRIRADERLETLYTKVLMPAGELLYQIEKAGIGVDLERVEENRQRLQADVDRANETLQKVAAHYGMQGINPNSPYDVAILWFDKAKLKPLRPGNRSTAAEVMDKLPKVPAVTAMKAYRRASKLLSTYVTSIVEAVEPSDGRVHSTYLLHGTRTGRLSSRGPNMQNIPRDKAIRGQFRASRGKVFVKVDLNQAELRSLALFSGDPYLVELYQSNTRSLHNETAEEFYPGWERLDDKVLKEEQKMRAKAVNFGIVYGREAPSLAEEFNIRVATAQSWIRKWFDRSPRAESFIRSCRMAAAQGKTLVTPFGRKKRHHLVTQENLQALQNEASNFPHQSVASDICLLGAVHAWPKLRSIGALPVNLVHDEFMVEVDDKPEVIKAAQEVIIEAFEYIPVKWGLTLVPFKAEADVGERWGTYR